MLMWAYVGPAGGFILVRFFLNQLHRTFHGRRRHLGSGANAAKFTVNVWGKS